MECLQWWLLFALLQLGVLTSSCDGLSVTASFNQRGVNGSIFFIQTSSADSLNISVELNGLDLSTSDPIEWSVHALPFTPSDPRPCPSLVGPLYQNLSSHILTPSTSVQTFSDSNLTLFGRESIIGGSLLIKVDEDIVVCSTIGYPSLETQIRWAPFRANDIATGNVFLWQHTNQSVASILVNVTTTLLPPVAWSILSAEGNGTVYNLTTVEGVACSRDNWTQCAVGDLSGRNGDLSIDSDGVLRQFLTDPGLPLDMVGGWPLALSSGERSVGAVIRDYFPLEAVAEVTEVGGRVKFTQRSPLEATLVSVTGLEGMQYAVHTFPPTANCTNTGGTFDPRTVGNTPEGDTLDSYQFGNLSGKFGSSQTYSDPYLPLSGRDSVIGRALVVTREGVVSGCGLIRHAGDVVEMKATLSVPGFSGTITFTQPARDPFADTVITIETDITVEVDVFTSTPSSPVSTSFTPAPSSPVYLTPSQSAAGTSVTSSSPLATPVPMGTSFPSILIPFPTPSLTSSSFLFLPTSVSFLLLPSPTVLEPDSSGDRESALLPLETTVNVMGGGRRRRREASAAKFRWSLRRLDGSTPPDDCSQLDLIGESATTNCSPDNPLSCAAGDLTAKHGPLPFGVSRYVIHDPYLPLSGSNGVVSAVLLVQPANGVGDSVCVAITEVTMTTTIIATPIPTPSMTSATDLSPGSTSTATRPQTQSPSTTASPPGSKRTGVDTTVLVVAVVGGVVGAGLLLAVVVVVVCVCLRRWHSGHVNLSKQGKKGRGDVEMGRIRRYVEPQIGSDQYRALCPYHPQQSGTDDLPLEKGEWVTLLEAPYGGQWWRGQTGAGEGWFPKTYVEYVDREAERKKAEEDNFKLAAAAIVAASSSFSLRHGTLATTKTKANSFNRKRSTTINKSDIVSVPVETTKADVPPGSVVIENDRTVSPSTPSSSRPNTPHSPSGSEGVHYVTGTSQESSDSSSAERILHLEPYLAKYNYVGGTEIELPLKKGEVVSVIEKAASGWWQGVCGGKVGWFPASYVKPVVTEEQKGEERGALLGMEESLRSETLEATEYRAVHTFSSDQEGDLQFAKGDSILVYWVHDSGWWYGSKGSMQGWFPRTYVEPNAEGSETGSAVPSPVPPQSEEEVHEAASSGESKSPQRRRKKKWSFKRNKSQEEGTEDGHTPLIGGTGGGETGQSPSRTRQQSKPRRQAPPPPTTEPSSPKATRATPPPLATPSPTQLTLTTTSASEVIPPHQPVAMTHQPVAMKRKRRTTAGGVDPHKPRRQPPPPPSKTTPQTPPTITEAVAGPSGDATPVAPPRRKPRIKRVKRPSTRLIPPPPSVPLPPPPTRSTAASPEAPPQPKLQETARPSQEAAVTSEPGTAVEVEGATAVGDKKTGADQETETVAAPSVRTKPPVKPKPAHLSRWVTEPSLKPSLDPSSPTATISQPPPVQGSPKPAPPARRSSLPAQHPPQAKREKPAHPLATVADPTEDTDSPQLQETAEAVRNLRSAPPQHPPPPRPATDDSTTRSSQRHRSNPPSFPPPQRPDNTTTEQTTAVPGEINASRSSSIKARGTQLMRSLKRIVQRSEEGEESEQKSRVKVQEGEVIQNLQTDSPVPQHRKLPEEGGMSPPARPPPPQLARAGSGDHNKRTPSHPPPPSANGTMPAGHTPQSLPASTGSSPAHSAMSPSRSTSPQLPTTFYRAKWDYTAQSPSELTFHMGDILVEIDRPTSAMSYGMLDDGSTGLFPASAVEPVVTPSNK